jgi:hypothetical protein
MQAVAHVCARGHSLRLPMHLIFAPLYMAIGVAARAQGSWWGIMAVYLSDYATEICISWPTDMPDVPNVPNVHVRQTRLPRCKCKQHRRWHHRWYPTATAYRGRRTYRTTRNRVAVLEPFSAPIHQNASNCSFLPPHLTSRILDKS